MYNTPIKQLITNVPAKLMNRGKVEGCKKKEKKMEIKAKVYVFKRRGGD